MKANDDNFTKKATMRNNIHQKKLKYTCIFHCPVTVNDIINSIDLKDDKVVIGTLMGDVFLCRVDDSKLSLKPKKNKKVSIPSLNLKSIIEDDDSNMQLYEKSMSNKSECIKLTVKDEKSNNYRKLNLNNNEKMGINSQDYKEIEFLKFPKITQLIIRSRENIPCIEFENSDEINICIGDLEIIHLEHISTFNKNDKDSTYTFSKLRNYNTENEHIEFCETATCFLKNTCFLIIFTVLAEFDDKFEIEETKYENKNLSSGEIIKGKMNLSNYVVPFDFDGDMFLYIDYKSKEEKFIGIEYTSSQKKSYFYKIKDKTSFGHISHMKLMSNERIFLVRNQNQCEIRSINKNFDIIEKFKHLGEEVITCCLYNNENEENEESYNKSINDREDFEDKQNELCIKTNRSTREKIESNLVKLFKNKLNLKENKEKKVVNTNTSTNVYSKSRMVKLNKYKNEENSSDVNIYEKINKIISSMDNHEVKYNFIHTETSLKKKSLLINSNSQSLEKSSTNKKNVNNNNFIINVKKINKMNVSVDNNKHLLTNKSKNSYNQFTSVEIFDKNKSSVKFENKKNDEKKTIVNKENNYQENYIITLDVNGTIYLYHNNIQKALFNIYEIKNIKQKYKNLKFFDMGFPYYIIANKKYICITTDSGLYVFSQIDE